MTQAEIAAAALRICDRQGLSALSMRAVAGEIGIGTMSLYRYVAGREELERRVVDLVLETVDLGTPARSSWKTKVKLIAGRIRTAVGAHPAIVPLLMAHRHSSDGVRRCAEALLEALEKGGFTGKRRVIALRATVSYINGVLQAQHLGPLSGSGTELLAALPAAKYPLLAQTARHARAVSDDEEFRGGLEILIRGLSADGRPLNC